MKDALQVSLSCARPKATTDLDQNQALIHTVKFKLRTDQSGDEEWTNTKALGWLLLDTPSKRCQNRRLKQHLTTMYCE